MATVVSAASCAAPAGREASAVADLAGRAAKDCLSRARLSPEQVSVLINVGVYRENNTFEPAIGALVQREVGINLDYTAAATPSPGFSLDLMNGACGVLNAVQVAQVLLDTGSADRVLITAADVHPTGRAHSDPDYPYRDFGAALLLARCAGSGSVSGPGFGPVGVSSPGAASTTVGFLRTAGMGESGRGRITVRRDEDFAEQVLAVAARTVAEYGRAGDLDPDRVVLIASGPTADFPHRLAERVGLDRSRVLDGVRPDRSGRLPHTAAPILGYLEAVARGLPRHDETLVLVSDGAGPCVACVSYRPEP
jgi:3-oxoacyl-[acyl-carrier-protein] synthase-3